MSGGASFLFRSIVVQFVILKPVRRDVIAGMTNDE
jgi:hypothetical protein